MREYQRLRALQVRKNDSDPFVIYRSGNSCDVADRSCSWLRRYGDCKRLRRRIILSDDLTFSIMIDTDLNEAELIGFVLKGLVAAEQVGGYIKYERNVLKFEKNSLYDKERALEGNEKSWMYYRYSLSVFPVGNVALEDQRAAASRIIDILNEAGAKPEIISEFEL